MADQLGRQSLKELNEIDWATEKEADEEFERRINEEWESWFSLNYVVNER